MPTEKDLARSAVHKAIRSGRLKVGPCAECALEPAKIDGRQRIHAHHHKGYQPRHWLDVQWLCIGCHFECDDHGGPRKSDQDRRDTRIAIRFRPTDIEEMKRAAGGGRRISAWARPALLRAARRDNRIRKRKLGARIEAATGVPRS